MGKICTVNTNKMLMKEIEDQINGKILHALGLEELI